MLPIIGLSISFPAASFVFSSSVSVFLKMCVSLYLPSSLRRKALSLKILKQVPSLRVRKDIALGTTGIIIFPAHTSSP